MSVYPRGTHILIVIAQIGRIVQAVRLVLDTHRAHAAGLPNVLGRIGAVATVFDVTSIIDSCLTQCGRIRFERPGRRHRNQTTI